jgi:quercetin dioxygenase-like cupin family protein
MEAQEAIAVFEAEGCGPSRRWSNGPDDRYGRHDHQAHKVLFCLEGSIVFHLDDGEVELRPGDRLDLPARTRHAATVGPSGCVCIEAYRG